MSYLRMIKRAAEQHGKDSDPDHEVGDLQDALNLAFERLGPEDQRQIAEKLAEDCEWLRDVLEDVDTPERHCPKGMEHYITLQEEEIACWSDTKDIFVRRDGAAVFIYLSESCGFIDKGEVKELLGLLTDLEEDLERELIAMQNQGALERVFEMLHELEEKDTLEATAQKDVEVKN